MGLAGQTTSYSTVTGIVQLANVNRKSTICTFAISYLYHP